MPAAADSNEPVFFHADGTPRTLSEIYNRFAAKFSGAGSVAAGNSAPADAGFTQAFNPGGVSVSASPSGDDVTPTALGDSTRASLYEMMVLSQLSQLKTTPGTDKT
jgi:hypothetical protein